MRWLGLLTSFGVNLAGSAPHASIMEELLQLGDFDDRQRHATLVSLVAMAKVRRQLEEGGVNHTKPAFNCPEPGAGVPVKSEHVMEDFHYKKFRMWAEDYDFCSSSLGLWTGGCGAVCGLRAAVVGHMVQLRPGQLVLDVGSGCGHFAEWFYDWFGAQTIGVDFQKAGVDYANHYVATSVPAQFCWMDVASQLSSRWLPARSVDLAIAISVLEHFLRGVLVDGEAKAESARHRGTSSGDVERYLQSIIDCESSAAQAVRRIAGERTVVSFEEVKQFVLLSAGERASKEGDSHTQAIPQAQERRRSGSELESDRGSSTLQAAFGSVQDLSTTAPGFSESALRRARSRQVPSAIPKKGKLPRSLREKS